MKRPVTRSQTKNMKKNVYEKLKNQDDDEERIEFKSINLHGNDDVENVDNSEDDALHKSTKNKSANNEAKKVSGKVKHRQIKSSSSNDESLSDDLIDENEASDNESTCSLSCLNKAKKQDLRKDFQSICLLMGLYFLQGIPLGLTGSLPFILSSRKVSYADQGTFSFAFWPFSLKLLWAPIVDSVFIKRIGRRKSWLVPIQYLIGIFMIVFANYTRELLEGKPGDSSTKNDIFMLTFIFFMFTFLAATQDICVDGWALTMLSKENVSWASTCNSVGQTAGWFVGNVLFLTIESAEFSNQYLRPIFGLASQTYGICTIDKFMFFFGIVFIVSTTLVFLFKKETDNSLENHEKKSFEESLTVKQTYKLMWNILWLPPIKTIILVLMTVKIGFAAESMSYLKLIEAGVPKEKLGLLAVPLTPLQIILPLLISRYTNGPYPFNFFIKAIPFRLASGIVIAIWVYLTPFFKDSNNNYPFFYYIICLFINAIHSLFTYSMFVSQMAFFSKISDKKIGGTYMTFLNTISNMGGNWPSTAALYLGSWLTIKACSLNTSLNSTNNNNNTLSFNSTVFDLINNNTCSNESESKKCTGLGGSCETKVDAFYLETAVFTLFGIIWIFIFKKVLYSLQSLPKKSWKISKQSIY